MNFFALFLEILHLWLMAVDGMNADEDEINCDKRIKPTNVYSQHQSLFHDAKTCCDGEKYLLGTTSDYLQYFHDCNVEPQNITMSLVDSTWTFFECVIKKGLGTNELTRTNFAELLAGNLSYSKRSAIFSKMRDMKTKQVKSNGNDQLRLIKLYWAQYFDAEYQVCTKSSTYSQNLIKQAIQRHWEPSRQCLDEKIPTFFDIPFTTKEVIECTKSVRASFFTRINNTQMFLPYSACFYILSGHITREDLNKESLKYDDLITNTIPNYFSKSLKKQLRNIFWEDFRAAYSNGTETTTKDLEIFQKIKQSAKMHLGDNISTASMNAYINMFVMSKIIDTLFSAITEICKGTNRRKQRKNTIHINP